MIGENGPPSLGVSGAYLIAAPFEERAHHPRWTKATSSLDAENETEIQQAISGGRGERRLLDYRPRMRTVENANKIVALSGGTVVETGTRRADGTERDLARMVQLQTESQNWALT